MFHKAIDNGFSILSSQNSTSSCHGATLCIHVRQILRRCTFPKLHQTKLAVFYWNFCCLFFLTLPLFQGNALVCFFVLFFIKLKLFRRPSNIFLRLLLCSNGTGDIFCNIIRMILQLHLQKSWQWFNFVQSCQSGQNHF